MIFFSSSSTKATSNYDYVERRAVQEIIRRRNRLLLFGQSSLIKNQTGAIRSIRCLYIGGLQEEKFKTYTIIERGRGYYKREVTGNVETKMRWRRVSIEESTTDATLTFTQSGRSEIRRTLNDKEMTNEEAHEAGCAVDQEIDSNGIAPG